MPSEIIYVKCVCGKNIQNLSYSKHLKSNLHYKNLKNKNIKHLQNFWKA